MGQAKPGSLRLGFDRRLKLEFRDGYQLEQGVTAELSKYEDSREAMRAFVEKREPVFKGR